MKCLFKVFMLSFICCCLSGLANAEKHHSKSESHKHGHHHKHFNKSEKREIENIVMQYLLENPEFLIKVSKKLQEKQMKAQKEGEMRLITGKVDAKKDIPKKILKNTKTPYIGSKDAKVAVIEFFDYQCAFCSKVAPVFDKLIKNNPSVKFIFKDFPIFGNQWFPSNYAANAGVVAFNQGGSDLYAKYHHAIFASGKDEGNLKIEDINKIAKSLKIDLKSHKVANDFSDKIDHLASIKDNMKLGSDLSIMGTPFIIVMPVENYDVHNVTVFSGYPVNPSKGVDAAVKAVQHAIDKAAGKHSDDADDNDDDNDKGDDNDNDSEED